MEDRLLRAAKLLDLKSFEQYDKPYPEIAYKFVSGLTRGGHVKNYKKQEVIENTYKVLNQQDDLSTFSLNTEKLPLSTNYFNFDTPDDGRGFLEDIKSAFANHTDNKGIHEKFVKVGNKYKEIFGITKKDWYDFCPNVTYNFNKEGMRNDFNFADVKEKEFIPVFGDSNTLGMGLPIEEVWYNKLNLNMPIFNSAVCSASLIDIYILLVSMYRTKKFDTAYICSPHSERWTGVTKSGNIEGVSHGQHYILKQFLNAEEVLNTNTRQLYRWMALQSIVNFCLANDIKLHIWENNTFRTVTWCAENNIPVPNWLFMHKSMIKGLQIANDFTEDYKVWPKFVARDMTHFGTDWHDAIADFMLTNEPI